jgi:ATP-binding cassette, subfamily F, member 3
MSILTAHNVSKEFGPEEIFSGISLEIPHKARIALVGPNGAGKTTLISILIGSEPATEGTITKARGLRIGFLPQRPTFDSTLTLWQEMMTAFEAIHAVEAELHDLSGRLNDAAALERYGELQERFAEIGGYVYESRTRGVLAGVLHQRTMIARCINSAAGRKRAPCWQNCCWNRLICWCWTNPPIIWTSMLSNGWRAS